MTLSAGEVAGREAAMEASKAEMMDVLTDGAGRLNGEVSDDERRSILVAVHRAITAHVNHVESSIAQDEYTGANRNEQWRTYKAETALNLLEVYPNIFQLFEDWCERLGDDVAPFRPSRAAMASMQRLVAEVYPDDVEELRGALQTKGLPVRGFDSPVPRQPPPEDNNASVDFYPSGGLKGVRKVSSEDAARIATNVVHKGPDAFSAPASPSPAADLVRPQPGELPSEPGWLQRQWADIRDSPAKIFIRVVGGIIGTALVILLVRWGCMPQESEEVSTPQPTSAEEALVPGAP